MIKKSFANRLILTLTCVVFSGFLAVYFLFNHLIDNHIRSEAERELGHEMLTVRQHYQPQLIFPFIELTNPNVDFLHLFRGGRIQSASTQAILSVDTILIDENLNIIHPNPAHLTPAQANQKEALAHFWHTNSHLFEHSEDMVLVQHDGHSFYMRSTQILTLNPRENVSLWMLMYTDITPAMNLKNNMNQVLIALLATVGIISLSSAILLSTRFKNAIKRLSNHAQIIGTGQFDEKLTNLAYNEFDDLASNMNTMAEMLDTYEKSQKKFFQNASHELRTPLMSIQGYTEGLDLGIFDDPTEATSIILEESHKMKTLIDEILYLSKLHEVSQNQPYAFTNVNTIITNATTRIQGLISNQNISLSTQLEPTQDTSLYIHDEQLERAILNILANGVRYAKNKLILQTNRTPDAVILTISNDGPLIEEADLPHLFERFYKGENGNTGLGLAITKEIITKFGGTVTAQNETFGVTFKIKLPIEK